MLFAQIIYSKLQRYTYVGWKDTIVSGWGASGDAQNLVVVDTLQWVNVPPVSDATCNEFLSYDGDKTSNMICAGKAKEDVVVGVLVLPI